jgi:flagellar hook-associated protein 1
MSGIGSLFTQGKSALAAAQMGMNTTAKNVANVNTDGYSRQRVDFENGEPESLGPHRYGGGVQVAQVIRANNEFLGRRIALENTELGRQEGLADIYNQMELLFREDGDEGINGIVSKFFNDIRTLSTQPDSTPLRAAVRESAAGITSRFQTLSTGVDQIVTDIDRRIEGGVNDINTLTNRIAQLNQQINSIEAQQKSQANDERDQRDIAVQKLSKLINVEQVPTENGGIIITAGRLGPLVVGADAAKLTTGRAPSENGKGATKIFLVQENHGAQPQDVTDRVESGSLGGLLSVRDQSIPNVTGKIDQLAFNLANEVNRVHQASFTRDGKQGAAFFADPGSLDGAASKLKLSGEVMGDLSNIATAQSPNASGDNRGALRMADLQSAAIFDGGKSNFTDLASSIVGTLGVQARSAYQGLETQQGLVEQLGSFQKEVSGVSLDEEAMNMLKFQKAFDASAKMIQLADNMLETVINLKRF